MNKDADDVSADQLETMKEPEQKRTAGLASDRKVTIEQLLAAGFRAVPLSEITIQEVGDDDGPGDSPPMPLFGGIAPRLNL